MREGRPSTTAMAVSFLRGVASLPGETPPLVQDSMAVALLPDLPARVLEALSGLAQERPWVRPLTQGLLAPLARHLMLRTAAIDLALTEALAEGVAQVVLVGAGLDARAWRLSGANGARFWELDHPDTQAWKRRRVAGHPSRAAEVRFVQVDFATDSLADRLADEGHRADAPTFWIWEGVTMYLPLRATRASLADIRRRSAPGSSLIVSYAEPGWIDLPRALEPLIRAAFGVIGERLVGAMDRATARSEAERAGFTLIEDAGPRGWARRLGVAPPRLVVRERLLLVEVPGVGVTTGG